MTSLEDGFVPTADDIAIFGEIVSSFSVVDGSITASLNDKAEVDMETSK
jgi:hypothetical protein